MTTRLMTAALATIASVTLQAQAPQTTTMPQPPDHPRPTITQSTARATPANPSMTISGCLTQRDAVKGAAIDPRARGGMPEDYILTNVKM